MTAAEQAKYDKLRVKRDALFNRSLPILEKALDMAYAEKGDDATKIKDDKIQSLTVLKALYTHQNNLDKVKEVTDKLSALGVSK